MELSIRNLLSIAFLILILCVAISFQEMFILPTFAGVISPVLIKGNAWVKVGAPAIVMLILSVLLSIWFREPWALLPGTIVSVYLVLVSGLVMKGLSHIGKSNKVMESDA